MANFRVRRSLRPKLLLVLMIAMLVPGSVLASATPAGLAGLGAARNVSGPEDPDYPWNDLDEVDFPPFVPSPLPGLVDPTYPELPMLWPQVVPGKYFMFSTGVKTVGRTESVLNKQKIRLPLTQMAAGINFQQTRTDACSSKPFPGVAIVTSITAAAVGMPGPRFEPERPDRLGYFPPTTVHAVAFGAVPTELTIQLFNLRDDSGVIEPLIATAREYKPVGTTQPCAPKNRLPVQANHTLKGRLGLRVLTMSTDGRSIPVGRSCQTSRPIELDLTAPAFKQHYGDPAEPPSRTTKLFHAPLGGYLKGTVDIAPFTGCGVGSEDLDPLLTMSLSGDDTPLELFQTVVGSGCFPRNLPGCEDGVDPFPLDSDATW